MTQSSHRTDSTRASHAARAGVVLALSLSYLAYVFQVLQPPFWTAGVGDWMDPYFINALLEHWYRAVSSFADPASPPMYYPADKTLGYSHGLILYAPFYVPLRLFFHPFQAYNLTLFLVMLTGVVCLYVLFRSIFRLTFAESLLLGAFFVTSPNVINEGAGIWSQRASVFLVPPILLLFFSGLRLQDGPLRFAAGFLSALLAMLLFTQDFYTAHFALLFALLFLIGAMLIGSVRRPQIVAPWAGTPMSAKVVAIAALAAAAWACYLVVVGGGSVRLFGVTLRSNDWRRPALIALVLGAMFFWLRGMHRTRSELASRRGRWATAVGAGAVLGGFVFLWIYVDAYRQHRAFPERDLLGQMLTRDASFWRNPFASVTLPGGYGSARSLTLVLAAACLLLVWRGVDRKSRLYAAWLLPVSAVTLLAPVRFESFSLWIDVIAKLPGFGVIRDPKRIVYVYELAVVLGIAFLLARLPPRSLGRLGVSALLLLLLVLEPNRERFDARRRNDVYERWVAAPIDIDPACASFFIRGASQDYMSRRGEMRFIYNIDATFVALNHALPTLNGYSAWAPEAWALHNPHHDNYREGLAHWIDRHQLTGVCEFDVDARTMKPYSPTR